jgi:hypothetical protein
MEGVAFDMEPAIWVSETLDALVVGAGYDCLTRGELAQTCWFVRML